MNSASIQPIDLIAPGGIHIAAYEAGPADGPVMILLPGWPQTARAWRLVQPLLTTAGYRSLAIDLPGMGNSDFLSEGVAYDTGHVADLLSAAVAAAGIKSYTLIGHDVGTWVAYAWATRHPEAVARLCLTEAAVPGVTPNAAFGIANAAKIFQFYFCAVEGLPEILTNGREREFFKWLFENKSRVKGAVEVDEYAQSYSRPGRMSAGFEYYRAVPISMKQNAAAPPPQMPLLALGGEGSVGNSLFRAIEAVAPQTQGGVVPGIGHYLPEEAPEDLVDRLLAFATASSKPVMPEARDEKFIQLENHTPGYWIARAKVIDPVAYKSYTDRVPAILQRYGGEVLSRGARYETLEGPDHFDRFVLLKFDSDEAAKRCFQSPEYAAAASFRRLGAGENELTVVGAGDGT